MNDKNVKTLVLKNGITLPILNIIDSYQNSQISIIINVVFDSLSELDEYINCLNNEDLFGCTVVNENSSSSDKKYLFYKYMKIIKRDEDYLGVFYFKTLSDYEILKMEFEEYKNTMSETLAKISKE